MVYWRQLVYNTRVNTRLLQQGAQPQEDWLQKQGYCVLPQTQAPQILTDTHQALHVGTKPLYHLWRPLILRPLLAPLTWWTWVWASSRSWWWTEKPGVLQSMGSQRVEHDWATELNWTEVTWLSSGQRAWWGWKIWLVNWAWSYLPFSVALWDLKGNEGWSSWKQRMQPEWCAERMLWGTDVWSSGRRDRSHRSVRWSNSTHRWGLPVWQSGVPRVFCLQPEEDTLGRLGNLPS